jgi:hypothetical protein
MRFACPTFLALAPLIGGSEPEALGCDARTTTGFLTFAATLFGPSCDALVSGHGAIEISRRRITSGPSAAVLSPRRMG